MSIPGASVYAIDCNLRAALGRADRALGCPASLTLRELHDAYGGPRPSEVGFLASYSRRYRKQELTYRYPGCAARYVADKKLFHFTEEKR